MPLYEYQCDACEHRFELIQKFSDPLASTCPSCGGTVRKLLSSPAFQFKGSGWYVTDYARKGRNDGEKGDGEKKTSDSNNKDGDKAESKSSESKTAAESKGGGDTKTSGTTSSSGNS